jgi:hypothetical protein
VEPEETGSGYWVWGVDNAAYGPVELPALVDWVRDDRVTSGTWVFSEASGSWHRADHLPELQVVFKRKAAVGNPAAMPHDHTTLQIKPGALRRVRIFAELRDEQLAQLERYMEMRSVQQFVVVVKQGDPGDAMFLILDGEVRVRLVIGGKETILTTLAAGEFFGEISLFDDGPRSADIVANRDTVLLRITIENFRRLAKEHPELAAPLLLAIGRTLTSRIRADNKRFRDSVALSRAGQAPGR